MGIERFTVPEVLFHPSDIVKKMSEIEPLERGDTPFRVDDTPARTVEDSHKIVSTTDHIKTIQQTRRWMSP